MNAVLVPTHQHISAWFLDNRENISVQQRVRNQATMKDGSVCRVFAIRGSIDVERLRGYEWEKIIITYGDGSWRNNVERLVFQALPPHSRQTLEFK